MKRLITVSLLIVNLAFPAYAGEILIKAPEKQLDQFIRVMEFINRVCGNDVPKALDKEKLSILANTVIPIVSVGRVKNLGELHAELFVMKDEVIVQMPDALLRERLQDAYKWCHVTQNSTERSKLNGAANAVLTVASFGRYQLLSEIPAEISLRFDDPKYERK